MANGTAESVDATKTMDRGKGDVQLLPTNRSPLPWIDGEPASCGRASNLDDGPFPSGCIVMPRLRLLKMASGPVGTLRLLHQPALGRHCGGIQWGHAPRRRGNVRVTPYYRDGVWQPRVVLVVAALAVTGVLVWAFAASDTVPPTLSVQRAKVTRMVPTTVTSSTTTTAKVVATITTTQPPLGRNASSRTRIPSLPSSALLATLSRPPVATSPSSAPPPLATILSTTTTTRPPATTTTHHASNDDVRASHHNNEYNRTGYDDDGSSNDDHDNRAQDNDDHPGYDDHGHHHDHRPDHHHDVNVDPRWYLGAAPKTLNGPAGLTRSKPARGCPRGAEESQPPERGDSSDPDSLRLEVVCLACPLGMTDVLDRNFARRCAIVHSDDARAVSQSLQGGLSRRSRWRLGADHQARVPNGRAVDLGG